MRPTAVLLCVAAAACAGACWYGDPTQQFDPDSPGGSGGGGPGGGPDLDLDIDLPDGSIRLSDGGLGWPDGGPWGDAGPRDGGPRDGGPTLVEGCGWVPGGTLGADAGLSAGQFPLLALPEGRAFLALGPPAVDHPLGASLYLPSSGSLAQLAQQPRIRRRFHSAVTLSDGRVLYVAGETPGSLGTNPAPALEAEVFDRQTGLWTSAGTLPLVAGSDLAFWERPAVVALPDGRALVLERQSRGAPFLWSPADGGTFTRVAPPPRSPEHFSAVTLASGHVLLAGGAARQEGGTAADTGYTSTWRFDPATGAWSETGRLHAPRSQAHAVRLQDGRVLLVGGNGAPNVAAPGAELYDPATAAWTFLSTAPTLTQEPRAAVLRDGRVLVTGGLFTPTRSDLFLPSTGEWRRGPERRGRYLGELAPVDDGSNVRAVLAGGYLDNATVLEVERLVCQ